MDGKGQADKDHSPADAREGRRKRRVRSSGEHRGPGMGSWRQRDRRLAKCCWGRNTHSLGNGDSEAEIRDALPQMPLRRWSWAHVRAAVLGDGACFRGPSLMGSVALAEASHDLPWPRLPPLRNGANVLFHTNVEMVTVGTVLLNPCPWPGRESPAARSLDGSRVPPAAAPP